MEPTQFDQLTRQLETRLSRRMSLGFGLGALLGLALAAVPDPVEAKKKRKRRKKKRRKGPSTEYCCPPEIVDGCCSAEFPVCCAPTAGVPDRPGGYCCRTGSSCCATGCCRGEGSDCDRHRDCADGLRCDQEQGKCVPGVRTGPASCPANDQWFYCPEDGCAYEGCRIRGFNCYETSTDCPEGQSFNCLGCGPGFTCPCGERCCEGRCQPISGCVHCVQCFPEETGSGRTESICVTEEEFLFPESELVRLCRERA